MLISIVIPVYNTKPEFIQETLDSINLLGNTDYEIILVNDGSTKAETLKYLENLNPSDYKNFQIIHKLNGGLSSARNAGIQIAKGNFIFPLDSDDKVNPDITHFINHLKENPNTEILYGDYSVFGDEVQYQKFKPFHRYELWLFNNQLCACSIYAKSVWEKVGGYDESFKTIEDWDFWCRCAGFNIKFEYLPYANYDYRIINNGQSMLQVTQSLIPVYHKKTLDKLPMSLIEPQELMTFMNQNLRQQLQKKRRKALGILIYTYFPKLFYWLCKKGLFSYKDNFIQL